MNRFITAAVATVAVAIPVVAVAAPAQAAANSSACMSRAEFRHVKHGMSVAQVKRVVGSAGKVSVSSQAGGYRFVIRDFKTCAAWHVSNISFDAKPGGSLRVSSKLYI